MLQVEKYHKGFISFKPQVEEMTLVELLNQKPLNMLNEDDEWDITANRYRQLDSNGAFQMIERLQITSLKLRWNDAKNILREIKDISFPKLQELYLNGNNIENIEIFVHLKLNSLKILNFKENNINQMKSLRKCHLPNLIELMLYKNKILDFTPLFEMFAPKLVSIWATPQNDSFDSNDTTAWVFKMESKRFKNLYVRHDKGQLFNFGSWRQMAKRCYPHAKLIYRIKDDIGVRLE